MHEPVNKFPDFVRFIVQRLKTLCLAMGKAKIAQTLAKASLHLGSTTVARILKEQHSRLQPLPATNQSFAKPVRMVTAKFPNHLWHVDITAIPIVSGFWATWSPFTLPQCWPFCWWVAVIVDHLSWRVMGISVWKTLPSSVQIRAFLGRTIGKTGQAPKYIVCDKGSQFWNDGFKGWCERKNIRPRFGAAGRHGSIVVIERFILTMKDQCTCLMLVPLRRDSFRKELQFFAGWYNEHRPHTTLRGKTPAEVYYQLPGTNRAFRFEPRSRWPARSSCASPQAPIHGKRGIRLNLHVTYLTGKKYLPIVKLRVAA